MQDSRDTVLLVEDNEINMKVSKVNLRERLRWRAFRELFLSIMTLTHVHSSSWWPL
jgi:hypothetical protein